MNSPISIFLIVFPLLRFEMNDIQAVYKQETCQIETNRINHRHPGINKRLSGSTRYRINNYR